MLDQKIDYTFNNRDLLDRALTHRSAGSRHNERLEWLGDAVLELVVREALLQRYPDASEGELTYARKRLVDHKTLSSIAARMELGGHMRLTPGNGPQARGRILADAVEAVFGAVYLDGGHNAAVAVVRRFIAPNLAALPGREGLEKLKSAKMRLQEWLQARGHRHPSYELLGVHGRAHERTFQAGCYVPCLRQQYRGYAGARVRAEERAAEKALSACQAFEQDVPPTSDGPEAAVARD